MKEFAGRSAVVTGGASGIGFELSRIAASLGMNVVIADVQREAIARAEAELRAGGAAVWGIRADVARADDVAALAAAVRERYGVPNLIFNNAGVGAGGLIWEQTLRTWEWVVGVNLFGVVHGVREFVPSMIAEAATNPTYEGHVINTASMAGLLNAPNMGVYNVTKHAVISLSETLYHDLALVTDRVRAHVLCPFFVPTGICDSERNRPADLRDESPPTASQAAAKTMIDHAVSRGNVSAAEVARRVFDAIRENRFYIFSHPQALASLRTRFEDILEIRNPTDPYRDRPEIAAGLRAALRREN